jgi:predicted Fe-Mo cluster-binding NifX family protein
MKIAVTSQNFRTVTPHAGRTRRFIVYRVQPDGVPVEVDRLDLPKEMSMHEFHGDRPHPLDAMDAVIVGSCGDGFVHRLARRGVRVVRTDETDPATAVRACLAGTAEPDR